MKHFFFFFFPGRTGQNTMNRERIINVYCPVPEDLEILQLCSNLSSLLLLCMNTEKYKPERSFFFLCLGVHRLGLSLRKMYISWDSHIFPVLGAFSSIHCLQVHNITCTFEVLLSLFQHT